VAAFFNASDAADSAAEVRGGRAGGDNRGEGIIRGKARGGSGGAGVDDLGVSAKNIGSDGSVSMGVIEIVSMDALEAAALGCVSTSTLCPPPGVL
jgi:hypothetical protein